MIEVTSLSRYYGDFAALSDVSFSAEKGQIVGLLGLNGAGKSTTLKILAGLIPPSKGTVVIDGLDLSQHPDTLRSAIGYLPENPPLYTDMRVSEFIMHIGRLKGASKEQITSRLPEVLQLTQLTDRAQQVIGTLSHGYRKRVGIAQALIHNPKLVILDEPISGLDPVQIVEMRTVIRNLAKDRAVIVSSHILSEVEQTCDFLVVLKDGKCVAQGTEEWFTSQFSQPALKLLLRGEASSLRQWLDERDWVQSAEITEQGHDLQLTVTLSEDRRAALSSGLIHGGFELLSMESTSHALEALFLGIAGGDT